MVPVINNHIQNGRMATSGQPFFMDFLDKSFEQIPFMTKIDIHGMQTDFLIKGICVLITNLSRNIKKYGISTIIPNIQIKYHHLLRLLINR